MTTTNDRYDVLCDVIEDLAGGPQGFSPRPRSSTRASKRRRPRGTSTCMTPASTATSGTARQSTTRFAYVRDPEWPTHAGEPSSPAELAFDARVRVDRFDLLREWVLVFDPRSRHLYSDQDRANVLMAVALSAQRIAGERKPGRSGT